MNDRSNTIAGWVLGAGIVFLGAWLVTSEMFHSGRPEKMGYPIEGVQEESEGGGEAEQPIAFYLQTADAGRGEAEFRRCATCHTINQGGANGVGPNLHGTMGANIAHVASYSYSDALRSHGGTWDWENMSHWIASPRSFAPGTKMTFAGMSDPQARADLLLYLNSQGGRLTVPPPPAAAAETPGANAAEAADAPANGQAPDQPEGGAGGGEAQNQANATSAH